MKSVLFESIKEAKDTLSFVFERPKNFNYLPGQYIYLTLPNLKEKDYRGPTRQFTLSSSPGNIKELIVTTRIRSGSVYKKGLIELQKGDKVEIEGPTGTFILDDKIKGDVVFLAGGIGITPFISGFRYFKENRSKRKLTLLYTNSIETEIAFYKELTSYTGNLPSLKHMLSLSKDPNNTAWPYLRGRIDLDMIKNAVDNKSDQKFFICGPPGFVETSESLLKELKIKNYNIFIEKFTGY